MLRIQIKDDLVRIGGRFSVSFQRTLRIPDDGKVYPLPPGLGRFPVCRVRDYHDRVPHVWRRRRGVFIPMYQREALWLGFDASAWKPNAVQVAVGGINAISGGKWEERLSAEPQNYLVCPNQPWLDGINVGDGVIRQFVAMPLGQGYSVEGQLSGKEELGGFQIRVYEPRAGRFPVRPPKFNPASFPPRTRTPGELVRMGVAPGGRMKQKIYPDPFGLDTWDPDNFGAVMVHIVNSEQYREITGHSPHPTSISAKTYTENGFPWFNLYDEEKGTLEAAKNLAGVTSVREKDIERGITNVASEQPVRIDPRQVKKL